MNSIHDDTCPRFEGTLELVGRRWTGSILHAAGRGARRFGEYRAMISGISDRMLSQRLKQLEAEGLIERTVIPSTPVRIHYRLAPEGKELVDALMPLARWSTRRSGARGGGWIPAA